MLFDNDNTAWVKRGVEHQCDVSMGAYDVAELYELVGLYALSILKNRLGACSAYAGTMDSPRRHSGSRADRARKDLIKTFGELGLKITMQTHLKLVDYLDVTFDLNTSTHQPYRKPNDTPIYVNVNSNHPPSILKHIPIA